MARTPSQMLPLGTIAPDFALPEVTATNGSKVSLSQFGDASAYLVMFICNHCPYVIHIRSKLAELTTQWISQGVAVFGVMSNDVESYPLDRPELMIQEKANACYRFPYLYDATQAVAKSYHAACTPDFYLFDRAKRLVYRGQFDDSRPGNGKVVSGIDLATAVTAVLAGKSVSDDQKASLGCNIKWRPGNEPNYFTRK